MKHSTILVTTSLTALALSISTIACSATQLLQAFISQHQLAKVQAFDTLEKNELVYQGLKRSYYLYTPTSYNSNHQIPLVLVFHGSLGTGRTIAKYTGFNDVAEREGFLVVYPDGINYHWHDARNIFNINVNDVSFTAALINHLQQKRNIDRHRIYATGMSNGAIFTHTLACMLPNQFAAFSSVAGSMPTSLPSNCQSDKSVSMLMLNGTDDPIVHYQGGLVGGQGVLGKLISVPGTIEFWRKYNKFPPAHLDSSLNPQTQILRYFGSQTGAEVILVTIKGGKHSWPGGLYERKKPKLGNVNISGISASQYIWNFFKRHTSP